MKSGKIVLVWVIGISLMSIVFLQGYLVYQDYLYREEVFKKDITEALSLALDKAKIHRANLINEQFREDLISGEYILMDSSINEDGFKRLMIIDKKSNNNLVEITFSKPEEINKDYSYLQLFLSRNHEYILSNIVYFWQEELGERLKILQMDADLDQEFLDSTFHRELVELDIKTHYTLYINSDSTNSSNLSSEFLVFYKWDIPQLVWAEFDNPFPDILNRSYYSILLGVLVLATTGICFYFLLGFWRKERKLSELKDVFIDNLAHELLTPITTLKLSFNVVESRFKANNEKSIEVEIAKEQLRKLDDISNRLHNVVSNEESSVVTGFTTLSEQAAYLKEKFSNDKRLNLNIGIEVDCKNLLVKIPAYYLQSVLINLIDNALKYGEKEPIELRISASKEGEMISILVADNGQGIPKSIQGEVFNKFFRHIKYGNDDPGGLGLGLFNVRQTLQHFNATISLLQSDHEGTVFQILIPINED
ncbi:sensor histidine kinase [Peijinzhouia sedimentorum]